MHATTAANNKFILMFFMFIKISFLFRDKDRKKQRHSNEKAPSRIVLSSSPWNAKEKHGARPNLLRVSYYSVVI